MGRLIYSAITSLDGYTEDATGDFQWSAPDEEVHRFVNDLTRPVGTHLLGRRMYETMAYWETDDPGRSDYEQDFASIMQGADKVVYSRLPGGYVRPGRGPGPEGRPRARADASAGPSWPPRPSRRAWSTSTSSS